MNNFQYTGNTFRRCAAYGAKSCFLAKIFLNKTNAADVIGRGRRPLWAALIIALTALLLLTGCGSSGGKDLEQIYLNYHKALQEENIEALKDFLAAEKQKEILGPDAEMKIKMIKGFMPTDIKVTGAEISGKSAVLKVEGKQQNQKMTGEVQFQKEGGKWKILKENWTMSMEIDTDDTTGSPAFTGTPGAFFDAAKPGKTPRVYQTLKGHQGDISALTFTPDNRCLVSAGYGDYTLRVWNIESGEEFSKVRTAKRVRGLTVSPDSSRVLTADAYNNITAWSLDEGILSSPKIIARGAGDTLCLDPQGEYFVTTGFRLPLLSWDAESGAQLKEITGAPNLRTLTFSKSGKLLANGSGGNTFTLWDTKNWKSDTYTISKVAPKSDVSSIDISSDEKLLAAGLMDSSIIIFDLKKRRELHNFYVKDAATMDVKFSPDCALLATAQYDKTVYLWDPRSAKLVTKLTGHSEAVSRLAFSPDGTTLASAGDDRLIFIWRSEGAPPPGQTAPVTARGPDPGAAQPDLENAEEPEMMDVDGIPNLIKNPYANQGLDFWENKGDVNVETDDEANPYFVIRYSGMIWQDVVLEEDAAGRWAVLVAYSSSERINRDGDQTGLPYLYGYMLNRQNKNRIDAYLQDDSMKHSLQEADKWGVVYGIFQVPVTSGGIRLFLQQADGKYSQNGSAARFDEPGVYLFDSREEAEAFAKNY